MCASSQHVPAHAAPTPMQPLCLLVTYTCSVATPALLLHADAAWPGGPGHEKAQGGSEAGKRSRNTFRRGKVRAWLYSIHV
jgi:hypothetical protein